MNSNHMYISEAFQDLGNLISILTNDAISATIEDISIILSIPVFRVREMIIQLSHFKELNGALVVEPVISSDENNFSLLIPTPIQIFLQIFELDIMISRHFG